MNIYAHYRSILSIGLISGSLILTGCGGSSSPSDEQVSAVSRGVITGFGSVYVNGVKFETDDSTFDIDDDTSKTQDDLRVGMIVTIHGHINSNGTTGNATRVTYDNEMKGPISAIVVDPLDITQKTLTIMGHQVLINADTTFDDDGGLNFDTLAIKDVVEVSGFKTENGFTATHIEKQGDDSKIELKGEIANLDTTSFDINGFNVSYDDSTELEDNIILTNGLYVEVKGVLDDLGTTLIASKIEAEHEGLGEHEGDDIDEAEVEGSITDYDTDSGTFVIQGQKIDASKAILTPASLVLANDLTVEAEGYIVDGVLIADSIKQKGQKIRISAALSAVDIDAGTVSFKFNNTDIVVRVNQQTRLEDDISDTELTLSSLAAGDFVEIKAFSDSSSVINAVELELKEADETSIKAAVDSFDGVADTITMLGVNFDLSSVSIFEDDDQPITRAEFYNELIKGEFVELKDSNSDDNFDTAELED